MRVEPSEARVPLVAPSEEHVLACRICLETADAGDLVAPCACAGSVRYVHRACLERWRAEGAGRALRCELCRAESLAFCEALRSSTLGLGAPLAFSTLFARRGGPLRLTVSP